MENIYSEEMLLFLPSMATLHTFSQLGAGYLLIALKTGSGHKSIVTFIKYSHIRRSAKYSHCINSFYLHNYPAR